MWLTQYVFWLAFFPYFWFPFQWSDSSTHPSPSLPLHRASVACLHLFRSSRTVVISTTSLSSCYSSCMPVRRVIAKENGFIILSAKYSRWKHLTVSLILGLPADTLQGHRERFHDQFHRYDFQGLELRVNESEGFLFTWMRLQHNLASPSHCSSLNPCK